MINPSVFNALYRRIDNRRLVIQQCKDVLCGIHIYLTLSFSRSCVRKIQWMNQSEFTWGKLSHPVLFKLTGNCRNN